MTTETTQETTGPTESITSLWYSPTTEAFSAMTSEERAAALERSRTERAAYQARSRQHTQAQAQAPAWDPAESQIHGELSVVGRAQADYERAHKALYRGDGSPKYSPEEHAERLSALHAEFDRTIGDVHQTLDTLIAGHQTTLQHIEKGDPLDALTRDELAEASAQMAYIKEDAQTLPPADLVTRCRVALQMGHKPTLFNLARYVDVRVTEANRVAHEGETPGLSLAERVALGDLTAAMRSKIRGAAGRQKAEATRTKLQTALETKATTRAAHDAVHDRQGSLEAELRSTGRYGGF